jgi:hypothetical protein
VATTPQTGTIRNEVLGDHIQRYYGGQAGLNQAVADAQKWQAARPPGTDLDAFGKWTPEAVQRPVRTEYSNYDSGQRAGAVGSGSYVPGFDTIRVDAGPARRAGPVIEHELTHALTAQKPSDNSVRPFSTTLPPGPRQAHPATREQLDYATTPVELDPRLAGIKRTYTHATGEQVNTIDAARRAWEFAKNPWKSEPQEPVLGAGADAAARQVYDTEMDAYKLKMEAWKGRSLNDQVRDHIEPNVIDYIDSQPEVRDTVIQRMLELVNNQGNTQAVKAAGFSVTNWFRQKQAFSMSDVTHHLPRIRPLDTAVGVGLGAGAGALSAAFAKPDEEGQKPWMSRVLGGAALGAGAANLVGDRARRYLSDRKSVV